ncbi:hypothetical protein [Nonomuraea sp. NPDC049480]|uniref:hypothetical protein n=1 Tax=Nonomuraea sp. NPDC049480 TaxID=3364353 RepID=UPI0037920CF4
MARARRLWVVDEDGFGVPHQTRVHALDNGRSIAPGRLGKAPGQRHPDRRRTAPDNASAARPRPQPPTAALLVGAHARSVGLARQRAAQRGREGG